MTACAAKQPTIVDHWWAVCGQPATARHAYTCPCGHGRVGETCAAHLPVSGEVGCAQCRDAGHECPMTATEVPR